jgi:hypothetical protein
MSATDRGRAVKVLPWVLLVLVVGGLVWRDVQSRRQLTSAQQEIDTRVAQLDSVTMALDFSVAEVAAMEARHAMNMARPPLVRDTVRIEIVRAALDTVLVPVFDSLLLSLEQEIATLSSALWYADSVIRKQHDVITLGREQLTLARGLLTQQRELAESWRRKARPFGLGCAGGPTVTRAGWVPVGLSCGISWRLW